ncbi:hypothetical protein FHU38_000824 [Saccharomonospora amisosensis]|uniref:HPr kinase n=1 Tax=Saccharomonospora amisosensis TaxID=1128677 RepID=A0A7X5ZPP8_9PSEU|nr:hypothetical protein [Saccharomonospora amisosensis]NIJ10480.1 hypothetical protein [Saccharomonospora amisosensis]
MTNLSTRRHTWTAHAGDLAFTMSAPAHWATDQQSYLAGYLPGPPGELDLGAFRLTVHLDDVGVHQIVWKAAHPPTTHRVEPIDGVVLLENREPTGRRCYAIAADSLEHQARAYAVAVHDRDIELFLHHTAARPHVYPLRLIREAMLRTYENAGGIVFHAAGVDLGGAGVMICGPRSAGKTTTLACLLRAAHGQLLSNDRLILHNPGQLIPVPLPVPVARGTLEAIDELQAAVPRLSRPQPRPDTIPHAFGATTKVAFSAREFAAALGSSLSRASSLRSVVVPRFTDTDAPLRTRRLDPAEARQVLAASCFTPHDEFWINPWLVPRVRADTDLATFAAKIVTHIAGAVPCVEVTFGVRNSMEELDKALLDIVRNIP